MVDLVGGPRGQRGYANVIWRGFLLVFLISIIAVMPGRVAAQTLTPDQLQQLQQNRGSGSASQQTLTPRETILEPNAPANLMLPVSKLEQILSLRAGVALKQFGYDQMGVGRAVTLPQMGAVQDDYVLGVGDEIVVSLRGQENSEYRATVDRDGRIVLPRINPLSAAGRTFGQFQKDLVNAVHRAYVSTEAFVSIGHLRQVSVLVSGEVGSPGVRTLTGLSTPLDAILISGGVKKSGSLRDIRILRGSREITVDLYSVLVGGVRSKHVTLADGDKIIVPPIGATIAVAGEARRPGIFELPPGRSTVSVREAVAMASGMTVPGSYTVSLLRSLPDGKRLLVDVTRGTNALIHDGEIVQLRTAVNVSLNQVTLVGAVRAPGTIALGKFQTLHDLLPSSDVLLPGAYMLFGIIDRTDPVTLQRTAIPYSPLRIIQGKDNPPLMSDDVVHVLTKAGMRSLLQTILAQSQEGEAKANIRPGMQPNGNPAAGASVQAGVPSSATPAPTSQVLGAGQQSGAGQEALSAAGAKSGGALGAQLAAGASSAGAVPSSSSAGTSGPGTPGSATVADVSADADLGGYKTSEGGFFGKALGDYRVTVSGAVHDPGMYMVLPGTAVAELLIAAGGLTNDVDLSSFELTSTVINNQTGASTTERNLYPASREDLQRITLRSYDDIQFRRVYSDMNGGFVTIKGEVRNPGTYSIRRGELLSSVLRRAGGMTDHAYPYGAVFTRASVAILEQNGNARVASEIRSQLLDAVMRPNSSTQSNSAMTADTLGAIQAMIGQLQSQHAVGRVSITADPAVLAQHPERDVIVEPGDTLVVPQRPSTVTVIGEVMQPSTFIFDDSLSTGDYIERAGGYTQFADTSRVIVVLPDGRAQLPEKTWISLSRDADIAPGTTIVVSRDVSSLTMHQMIVDFTQIFSQLATSAAALAVLSKY